MTYEIKDCHLIDVLDRKEVELSQGASQMEFFSSARLDKASTRLLPSFPKAHVKQINEIRMGLRKRVPGWYRN